MYAGTFPNGFFRSTNGGATWEAANTGLADNCWYRAIVVDPKHPNIIFALLGYGGVYKSVDYGVTWNASYWDMNTAGDVYSIAIDPYDSNTVYVGTQWAGILRSVDGGGTWNSFAGGMGMVNSIAIDPRNPQTIYAGIVRGSVLKTTNRGQTWSPVTLSYGIKAVAIDPANSADIFAGTESGVMRSTNLGNSGTWSFTDDGLQDRGVMCLAIDSSGSHLFRGTNGSSVLRYRPSPAPSQDLTPVFMLLISD